jgi:hypothetical protein
VQVNSNWDEYRKKSSKQLNYVDDIENEELFLDQEYPEEVNDK